MPISEDVVDLVESGVRMALDLGAVFADARIQAYRYELLVLDNGVFKEHNVTSRMLAGFRVITREGVGYASTSSLDEEGVKSAVERAVKAARASGGGRVKLADYKPLRASASSHYAVDPFTVPAEEKIELARIVYEAARGVKGVVSVVVRIGAQDDERVIVNSEGLRVRVRSITTGLGVVSVAKGPEGLEYVSDSESRVAGFEFIRGGDWEEMAVEASRMAVLAAAAPVPKAGSYTVVLDPEMVGLLLHEALGHASEGDLVATGASVIRGRLGQRIASEHVTIVDSGVVDGGYYVPYDDEGVEKKETVIVEEGVLRGYLTDRQSAAELGMEPTGNGRVQSPSHPILVRQTNYYMKPGDYSLEELFEGVKEGIYVTAKGSKGGEVDPGMGTFTFNAGVSWLIENGSLARPLRGVSLSGIILDVLSNIDAVGRDVRVHTSVFGGCGKSGQLVRVGDGGPHVRVRGVAVGGR